MQTANQDFTREPFHAVLLEAARVSIAAARDSGSTSRSQGTNPPLTSIATAVLPDRRTMSRTSPIWLSSSSRTTRI